MHWAGVVRISHMGARKAGDANVHADRDQIDAIERHARLRGATVTILPPELDVSGGLPLERRPSLLAAIEGVERGVYDGIIVAYLSRLGRNVREQLKAWDRVEAAGGRIIVVQEGIDTSTAAGRMHRTILLAIAEQYREEHAERFDRLAEWATMAGVWQRRQTPLGYTRDPETRKLVPDADAGKVRDAFRARILAQPVSVIARALGMTTSGTRHLLSNRVYLGELRVREYVNLTAHPPLIDAATFDAAQHARVTRPARSFTHAAMLAGLARCTGCTHVMGRARPGVVCYVCSANKSNGRCPAPAAITAHIVEGYVEQIALLRLERLRARGPRDDKPLRDARAALVLAEQELGAFLRGVQAADLAVDVFADAARSRTERVDEARDTLRRLVAERPPESIDGDPVAVWEKMHDGQRNRLLGSLIECVLIARAGGQGLKRAVEDRVRVVRVGAGVVDTIRSRGHVRPVVTVGLPALDDPRVLGMHLAQDEL